MITSDQPTVAEAGDDMSTCLDSVMLSPNTPTIGTGEWSVLQGSATFSGNKAYNLSRGENHLKWTISNHGCTSSDIVVITNNKPTASFTGNDKSVCVDSLYLPGNTPVYGTGVWTVLSGSGNIQDIHDAKSKVTNLGSGKNNFRWTITYNGCVSSSEVNISYDYIQADAGADQALCQSNAFLSANNPGAGSGQWSVVGGSGSANFVNPVLANTEVTNIDKGINVLKWTIINATCISTDNVVITNNKPSDAFAGSDRSVCGEQINLNANTPVIGTGEWSILSGSATIDNPALSNSGITNLSTGRNVLRWTVTNQECVTYDEVVINNDQPRNIEAGFNQYVCSDSVQLYATAPVSGYGRWSIMKGSATFEDNSRFDTKVFNLERGENKLIWTVTIAGCSNIDSVTVVNNLPSAPNAGPDQDICADNVLMAANMPLIGTGKWSVVSGSAVFSDRTQPGTYTSSLGNGENILRWTISNGSCTLYDEVTITNSLPTLAYAGEDRSVCNTSANLLATAPSSGIGSWSVVSGYGIFSNPNAHNAQITSLGFGQNTLRWTTEKGQCRTSDDVIITNNLADVYAGPDQVVYQNSTKLIGNKPSQGQGMWVVTAGNGTFTTSSAFETNVTGLGAGANTFNWTINNNGCIASDAVIVTYRMLPTIDFNAVPAGGCLPVTVSFINTSVGGTPYEWDFGDGSRSTAVNESHTYTIPGNYKVRLTGTGPDGIKINKETIVFVREIPVADFDVTPDVAFIPGNPVHFYNRTEGIDSLFWEFGDGYSSSEKEPTHTYGSIGDFDVTLHVWSGFGCYDSVKVSNAVRVEKAGVVKCPNAFTPNPNGPSGGNYSPNDVSNDVFHCYIEGVQAYHLEVYNRIGIRIFESNDVNIGWDGYFKGKLVEEGSYIFKVVGVYNNGKRFDYLGNIIVLH
jgi:PKD repeat protein